ncbi:hypothetical protein [Shewanella oncorhynchi]|uniref:hypothetical protein n=1 Tax=Shewanella oncorhynchi TaxID=2726434 RepID=UPI003D799D85
MPDYDFIEKITVLQHSETKNIVRLMIEHDGNRNYGLQCSTVTNGKTRHFYNNKIWHSVYQIKDELECRVSQYEEKGFDVVTEISLAPNKNAAKPTAFCFTDEVSIVVNNNVLPISAKDIPIKIECSFHKLDLIDLRYNTQVYEPTIKNYFESIRVNIDFLPFDMVAVVDGNQIKVLSLEFKSKPTPLNAFHYLRSLSKNIATFDMVDANTLLLDEAAGMNFAYYADNQLIFCITQSWVNAKVYIEKPTYSSTCKVFSVRDEQFCQIYQGEIANVTRSGNAEVKYSIVDGKPSEFLFLKFLGFEEEISSI